MAKKIKLEEKVFYINFSFYLLIIYNIQSILFIYINWTIYI